MIHWLHWVLTTPLRNLPAPLFLAVMLVALTLLGSIAYALTMAQHRLSVWMAYRRQVRAGYAMFGELTDSERAYLLASLSHYRR